MNYSSFCLTDDHSLNIALALDYCKKNGIKELTFPKDTYVLTPERASRTFEVMRSRVLRTDV